MANVRETTRQVAEEGELDTGDGTGAESKGSRSHHAGERDC